MAFFSTNSSDYASAINNLVKPTYTSKYDSTIESIMNDIANREEFSYDFNADPLYQNYKDQYTKLGKEAGMNAAAAVSTQTGGFGNSYAATAASQANQQYLTQLNDKIPELAEAALDKYQMETENLYNKFNMYETEENRQYGQYRDDVSDYYSDWSNLLSGYGTALSQENADRDYNYQVSRDAVADSQWQKQYDYQTSRDATEDSQWQSEFDYQKSRDAVADSQWEKEYQLAARKAASSGSSSSSSSSSSDSSVNKSTERSVTFQNAERSKNIIAKGKSLSTTEEKIAYLEKLANSDSSFTQGDYDYFAEQIGL